MTTPAQQKEADAVELAFHAAMTQLGAQTVQETLTLWQHVPPSGTAQVRDAWLRQAVRLVMTMRGRSRAQARAYYRLVRALRTGTTVADPRKPEPRYITLDVLRQEFEALVPKPASQNAGQEPASATTPTTPTPAPAEAPGGPTGSEASGSDRILVEEISALVREAQRQEREAEREAQLVLDALGPSNLESKLGSINTEEPGSKVDQLRKEAHAQAGARQAAAAARIAQNGSRAEIWTTAQYDKRTVGYVRLSRTGTPCGWCAMLISRGAVYKSEQSAQYADGDKYHDNCNCYAMPIFSREQYGSSDLFKVNREYAVLWPKVTKGLSGKAAVSAWRRFIRQEQAVARAQEAQRRPTSNVQEA